MPVIIYRAIILFVPDLCIVLYFYTTSNTNSEVIVISIMFTLVIFFASHIILYLVCAYNIM
jgi:hypothetical protein